MAKLENALMPVAVMVVAPGAIVPVVPASTHSVPLKRPTTGSVGEVPKFSAAVHAKVTDALLGVKLVSWYCSYT